MITKPDDNNTIPVGIQYTKTESLALFYAQKNSAYLEFNQGESWADFDSTKFTIKINSELKQSTYGAVPKSSIDFNLGGDNKELLSQLQSLVNAKLIFKVKLSDGQEKILGTKNKPCFLNISSQNTINNTYTFSTETKDIFRYPDLEDIPSGFTTGFSIGFRA